MDKITTNKLYWFVEELYSYTDFIGNRFDIDSAQQRLLPIKLIVEKHDLPKIKALYNSLEKQFEKPTSFNRSTFSRKVNELYNIASEMNGKS